MAKTEYDSGVTAVIDPPPQAARRRPFQGWGSAAGSALSAFAGALIQLTGKLYGQARDRSGAAVADFQARPEHSRWRAYSMAGYGALVAATLAAQLYTENKLGVAVRIERVEMPKLTQVFIRNDSDETWRNVKITLNGMYTYETLQVVPGGHVLLPVDRFALFDNKGHATYPPKTIEPQTLAIQTRDGRWETDFHK
ncbi:MAG TPA: hypothetical protein VH083_24095 [Myxococcales bacterium]|jgi:hypothetical protein|nr:hypothetical protein [Myxococcales bacterium]